MRIYVTMYKCGEAYFSSFNTKTLHIIEKADERIIMRYLKKGYTIKDVREDAYRWSFTAVKD